MTDPMTAADLDAIEQRAHAATEGPWEMYRPHHASGFHSVIGGAGGTDNLADDVLEADAEFIAHARSDAPALLAEVRRLQAAGERVRALHRPVDIEPSDTICGECSYRMPNGRYLQPVVEHPCPTIAALDAATVLEVPND